MSRLLGSSNISIESYWRTELIGSTIFLLLIIVSGRSQFTCLYLILIHGVNTNVCISQQLNNVRLAKIDLELSWYLQFTRRVVFLN